MYVEVATEKINSPEIFGKAKIAKINSREMSAKNSRKLITVKISLLKVID